MEENKAGRGNRKGSALLRHLMDPNIKHPTQQTHCFHCKQSLWWLAVVKVWGEAQQMLQCEIFKVIKTKHKSNLSISMEICIINRHNIIHSIQQIKNHKQKQKRALWKIRYSDQTWTLIHNLRLALKINVNKKCQESEPRFPLLTFLNISLYNIC